MSKPLSRFNDIYNTRESSLGIGTFQKNPNLVIESNVRID